MSPLSLRPEAPTLSSNLTPSYGVFSYRTCTSLIALDQNDLVFTSFAFSAFPIANRNPGTQIIVIEVQDTARAHSVEHLPRIFDAFFTTKAASTGTGLGLSIVKKIIDLHGGRIALENALPNRRGGQGHAAGGRRIIAQLGGELHLLLGKNHFAQLAERSVFYLADSFARELQLDGDIGQELGLATIKPESPAQNIGLAVGEPGEQAQDGSAAKLVFQVVGRFFSVLIGDDFTEGLPVVVAKLGVHRDRLGGGGTPGGDAFGAGPDFGSEFFLGWFALELVVEPRGGAAKIRKLDDDMDWEANGLGLIGQACADGLPNPPGGVGGEFHAAVRVEPIDGFHQADIALADEIEQRETVILVAAGNGHDEAQVGLDHMLAGLFIAVADFQCQLQLFFGREEVSAADLVKIQLIDVSGVGGPQRGCFLEAGKGFVHRWENEDSGAPRVVGEIGVDPSSGGSDRIHVSES